MFGGLTKTSSRIAIAAALGMTLGGFVMSSHPAKAADLGGDCCADLEERVAELEATTVRKGNKKVSVTISGWVVKLGSWWDDGHETNFYTGDKDTTLSSHIQISGSATIAPGWSAGYTFWIEAPGTVSVGFADNQFNDNANGGFLGQAGIDALDSFMWIKSDTWGTTNWGKLVQATNNLALLPDLSGTIIEANGVVFDGGGFFVRPKGARNSNDLGTGSDFTWGNVLTCISGGGGLGADCPSGLDSTGFRYDSPTWYGFSVSGGYYEDDQWDVAVKWAGDWNNLKWSAAYGFTENTDEGCTAAGSPRNPATCSGLVPGGGGGAPFQDFRKDVESNQFGASVLHVPTGLWAYGMYQNEHNDGTPFTTFNKSQAINFENNGIFATTDSQADNTNVYYLKAGIKRTWLPLGATVLYGQGGQYFDQFPGLCSGRSPSTGAPPGNGQGFCGLSSIPSGQTLSAAQSTALFGSNIFKGENVNNIVSVNGSTVNRWGAGIVQEIDSAAMHVFFNWQHLEVNLNQVCTGGSEIVDDGTLDSDHCLSGRHAVAIGSKVDSRFNDLDIFQIGGVIFF